ncbi:MAG: hypothetical protein RIS20_1935 [Bacteroidota bacterium]|jgi:hypothetical protein
MRILSTIFLLTVLLSKTFYGVFWQVNFRMNQREIARMECENKNRPEMHCNGKCYLAKQLQKAEAKLDDKKQTSSRSLEQIKWLETADFESPVFPEVYSLMKEAKLRKQPFFCYSESLLVKYIPSVFHPPC